jgi:hypothetical protein
MFHSTAGASPIGRFIGRRGPNYGSPTMEMEEEESKQVLEEKAAHAGRLHRSRDLFDVLLMSFTYLE